MTVNRLWNLLVDDLVLLGILAGTDPSSLQTLDKADVSWGSVLSCPPEETFLCRLLRTENIHHSKNNEIITYVRESLAQRHSFTVDLMRQLNVAIEAQRTKLDGLGDSSSKDVFVQLQKLDSLLKEEAKHLHVVIKFLHRKHEQYSQELVAHADHHARDQSEIKRLSGELEEAMAELEETRRKLVSLKMQKDRVCKLTSPNSVAVNGSSSPDKQHIGLKELKNSVEEAKILAAARLSELQEAQENNACMLKLLESLKEQLKGDKYITHSRPYMSLNEKLQLLNTEIERYRGLVETLQADRVHILRREKELSIKADSADAIRSGVVANHLKVEQLELQLNKCVLERNEIEIKLEDALQDSGRKDFKDEIDVMASALTREIEMMESQLKRCMEAACEAVSLREKASSLEALLKEKAVELPSLSEKCEKQMLEVESLRKKIEKLENEKEELQIVLDMYDQEPCESRKITEIEESERRALMLAETLKSALDEHSLELRVKAAREAESACQKRLSTAEVELSELKAKLDSSERELLELQEAIKVKDADADAYISEIENIGQAFEDMQTQNQHLQQQVVDRDDYNIKLVSESVKMRQMHSSLLSEKQAIARQIQQVTSSIDFLKTKISRGEEQMKSLLAQAEKVSVENRHLALATEKSRIQLAETESDLKCLKSTLESAEKEFELNQLKTTKLRSDLEEERSKGRRLKEELERVVALLEKMCPENEAAAIQKLQDEIKECKAILKCGVCFDRPKQVVITKCFHLFCSNCIQRNLEIRHRKCPACGTPFGQNDVKEVNI
ncbi:histone mono-ubiquitination 2 isoform X2 [Wolffia australiana]